MHYIVIEYNLNHIVMQYLFIIIVTSICFLLRTFIVQYYKYKRFKMFRELYKNEPFEKLSDYEEKSKSDYINILPKSNVNDG